MIGHRADGRRVEIDAPIDRRVWVIIDMPKPDPIFRISLGAYRESRCAEIYLERVEIWYPDDWQGPLESDWVFRDAEWRRDRSLYLEDLRHSCQDRRDVERLLNLKFPDDLEIARIVVVMCVIHLLRLCLDHELPMVRQRLTPWPGSRPVGRSEFHFVERGAPRFSGWV